MKKKALVLAALVTTMAATTLKAQLNVGSTAAPITTLDVQGSSYIKNNLGVGISAPTSKLHIAADASYNGGQLAIGGLSNLNQQLQLGFNTTSNQGYIQATVSGSTYNNLVVNPGGGLVGIGTNAPRQKLEVSGDLASYATELGQITISGSDNAQKLALGYNTTTDKGFIQSVHSGSGWTDLLLQPNFGKVGIGTTTPAQPLDVNATGNPIRFSNLAATSSTTNILAIDASGDIRSIPVASVGGVGVSGGAGVYAGSYVANGNESLIMSSGGIIYLPTPTAAQIGRSFSIVNWTGGTVQFSGNTPCLRNGLRLSIMSGTTEGRIIICAFSGSLLGYADNIWVVTSKDF